MRELDQPIRGPLQQEHQQPQSHHETPPLQRQQTRENTAPQQEERTPKEGQPQRQEIQQEGSGRDLRVSRALPTIGQTQQTQNQLQAAEQTQLRSKAPRASPRRLLRLIDSVEEYYIRDAGGDGRATARTQGDTIHPQHQREDQTQRHRVGYADVKYSLFNLFQSFGQVVQIIVKRSDRMRGQAFVVFREVHEATTAMNNLNGYPVFGKPLVDLGLIVENTLRRPTLQNSDLRQREMINSTNNIEPTVPTTCNPQPLTTATPPSLPPAPSV